MNCSQCGTDIADGAAVCPSCGAAQAATVLATSEAPTSTLPPPMPGGAPTQGVPSKPTTQLAFDAKRWSSTDRIVGVATVVLFISLFLPWFGVKGTGVSVEVSGLTTHGYLYIVLILCLLVMAYLVVKAIVDEFPIKLPLAHAQLMSIPAIINLVLIIIAFVFKPGDGDFGGVGWRWGAFVGLIAAIVAAAPKLVPAVQARMQKARTKS